MYNYSKEHNWITPINYSHSDYHGKVFFESYSKNREQSIDKIQELLNEERIEKYASSSYERDLDRTGREIYAIFKAIKAGKNMNKELSFFVRKFESTKLVYSFYDNKTKKGIGEFRNLTNYILLSFCCMELNLQNICLRFFNAGLKLNDLLISELDQITKVSDILMFKEILKLELEIFKELMLELL